MKHLGIHWTLNAFARRLRRKYIDLIANVPRDAKVRTLPRTAAGLPLLPPGLSDFSDPYLYQCTNALEMFYNDTYLTFASAVLHSERPWQSAMILQKDLWSDRFLRAFTHICFGKTTVSPQM